LQDGSKSLVEKTIDVNIGIEKNPQIIKLGATLSLEEYVILVCLLTEFIDVFSCSYDDIPGLDPSLMVHHLVIHRDAKPVKQKLRKMHPKVALPIKEEI